MHRYICLLSHIEGILWVHIEYIILPKQNSYIKIIRHENIQYLKIRLSFKNIVIFLFISSLNEHWEEKKKCGTKSDCNFEFKTACWRFHLYLLSQSESRSIVSDSFRPHGLSSPWDSPGQNTGVGSLSLFQGIFPTLRLNPGLLHCRQILYQLSY